MHVSSSSYDMHVSPSSCDMEVSPSTGHGARLVYPPPHLTCMYHPPRMTCMYPPPQDMVHVTLRARPTTAGPSITSASSSWTSPQTLWASRQCTSLLMLKVKAFFFLCILLCLHIYVYTFICIYLCERKEGVCVRERERERSSVSGDRTQSLPPKEAQVVLKNTSGKNNAVTST